MNLQPILNRITPIKVFGFSLAGWASAFLAVCLWSYTNPNGLEIALSWGQFSAHMISNVMSLIMVAAVTFFLAEVLVYMGPKVARVIYNAIRDEREKRDTGFTPRKWRYDVRPPHKLIHTLMGETDTETYHRFLRALDAASTTKGCVLFLMQNREQLEIHHGNSWTALPRSKSGLLRSTYEEGYIFASEPVKDYFQAVEEVAETWNEKGDTYVAELAVKTGSGDSPFLLSAKAMRNSLNTLLFVLLFPLLASAGISDEIRKGTPEAAKLVPTKEVTFCFGQHSFTRKQTGQKTALELLVREGVPFNDDASVGEYIGVIIDGKLHQAVHANTEGKKPAALSSLPADSAVQRKSLEEYDRDFVSGLHQISETGEKIGRTKMADWAISGLFLVAIIALLWAWVTRDETLFAAGGQTIFGHGLEGLNTNAVRVFVCAMLLAGSVWIAVTWFYVKLNDDWATPLGMVFNSGNLMLLGLGVMAFLIAKFTSWLAPNRRVSSYAPKAKIFTQHGGGRELGPGGN